MKRLQPITQLRPIRGPGTRRTGLTVALWIVLGAAGASAEEIYEQGEIILSLNPGFTIEQVNATWGTTTLDSFPQLPRAELFLLYADGVGDLEAFAAQMEADPAVNEAEANYFEDTPEGVRQMILAAVGGGLVDYEDQEITQRIGLDAAHSITRGAGVLVALIDTGVDPLHIALDGHLAAGGYDFVDDDTEPWEVANGIDDDGDTLVDDGYGHGTMVAGILALTAPDALILPIRALDDEGRGDAWQMTKAIRYAINAGADVINMSFGVPRTISPIGHQVALAESLGVVVVAASGNQGSGDNPYYPAVHSKALMITALDSLDVKADFADWNSSVNVSAPGTGVRSAYPGGLSALGSGCSFAAPWVAGEAALVRSLYSHLRPETVENIIEGGVDPIYHLPANQPYEDELGTGRINLPLALAAQVAVAGPEAIVADRLRAFPNPTRGTVRLRLERDTGRMVTVTIHDVSGRRVATLAAVGPDLAWDGRDRSGRLVGPGVYYVRVADVDPRTGSSSPVSSRLAIRVIR